jgi:hypothetical protein
VLDARNQRLKRAHDISLKHSELPKDLQKLQTPYAFYMRDALEVRRCRWHDVTESGLSEQRPWFCCCMCAARILGAASADGNSSSKVSASRSS